MQHSRRGFIGSLLGAATAAFALDPDKALWVPGQKSIFIPPAPTRDDIACLDLLPGMSDRALTEKAMRFVAMGIKYRVTAIDTGHSDPARRVRIDVIPL